MADDKDALIKELKEEISRLQERIKELEAMIKYLLEG